jgi:protein-S-isoprenylcysteine O-methyltransferase Ste14
MIKFGNFLFRWRGVIGFIAFVLIWLLSRPNLASIWISLPFILVGLFFRLWASGYLGKEGRSIEITTKSLITQGPYRFTRNPLYIGNFFLTVGVLIGFHSPFYLVILMLGLFLVEYSIIIKSEQDFLRKHFGNDYLTYCKMTGVIFPKSFHLTIPAKNNQKYLFKNALREIQTVIILLIIYGLIYLRMVIKI